MESEIKPHFTWLEKGEIQVEWTRKVQHNKTTLIFKLHFITKFTLLKSYKIKMLLTVLGKCKTSLISFSWQISKKNLFTCKDILQDTNYHPSSADSQGTESEALPQVSWKSSYAHILYNLLLLKHPWQLRWLQNKIQSLNMQWCLKHKKGTSNARSRKKSPPWREIWLINKQKREQYGSTLGVHFKEVSVLQSQRIRLKNVRDQLQVSILGRCPPYRESKKVTENWTAGTNSRCPF